MWRSQIILKALEAIVSGGNLWMEGRVQAKESLVETVISRRFIEIITTKLTYVCQTSVTTKKYSLDTNTFT